MVLSRNGLCRYLPSRLCAAVPSDIELLREIRDDQRALLDAYREATRQSLAAQAEAVARQAQMQVLYRRVVLVSAIAGLGLVGLVVVALVRVLALMG